MLLKDLLLKKLDTTPIRKGLSKIINKVDIDSSPLFIQCWCKGKELPLGYKCSHKCNNGFIQLTNE